ncbi:MAG: tRNA uridine-5-carboxymethylaminomethyl(34) synthesis GTPase MnmE [Lautropia sp.]|nr:MAG: tRNA uridine-5-carboxymethylaminomethyl(34) synthesis GTPase MnmE [Pseudomonadota bacterium]MBC6959318.1 tRNA uridine-5-carboxymethylaminomethyl(34) synthesis GTPase MnmE [Lautropia sp.]MCL4701275.1 tRNA uridine-5-carboxymethylaminomethyl(34) synthesis GTPase MnmE [Burkholderiaceae bacterium]MDL1907416.1 tRNA uridine-5-carboxymethylaminomethyl(34) synthesis GTPase MnmE [Betaproteobacteria bacterium PRO1]RIK89986.1 MAG: tRNA uridine-5-carboxymethylaminomethyl(34) synthesis GTPase MnmE [B
MSEPPIAAIATAPGRGGIGVVRVSGRDLSPVIEAVLGRRLPARHATYGPFLAADGGAIDQGIAIHFPAPHSYTGEDVLELQGHGGPVVLQLLLRRVLEAGREIGLRLAEPGEFTQRAFLNDKLDLAQAEAVADLIDASTEQAARSATRSLSGEFSAAVHALVERLIELRTLVEATLDFPEEEIDFLEAADARGRLARIRDDLQHLLANARRGALLRDGLTVVLLGEPNVGKSSLMNALAGAEVAIVTEIPGTTRDRIAQAIQIEGVPLNVIDTAGLRETADRIEQLGIARTWAEAAQADLVLHLLDARQTDTAAAQAIERELDHRLAEAVPVVRVYNKIDLAGIEPRVERGRFVAAVETPGAEISTDTVPPVSSVWLSAKTGAGIDGLRRLLLELAGWQASGESTFIARERHLIALRAAQAHVEAAEAHARERAQQLDLFAEELRLAQERLNEITGEFTADDLLGVIFSRFCIGK